jgi:uncharacterized protein YbaP (TraB family)
MKTHFIVTLLSLFFIFITTVHAEAPIWKVSKGDDYLYIAGTIHLLSKDDFPLPKTFDTVYKKTEKLIFETDMNRLNEPALQQQMMKKMTYQDGNTLKKLLKPKTYQALTDYLSSRDIPMANTATFKPSMIMMLATIIEMQRLGMTEEGVDQFYSNKAIVDKKEVGKLETVEQQLDFLATMGEGNEDAFIMHTLRDIKEMPKVINATREAWRKGDIKTMETLMLNPFLNDYPRIYQSLLVNRNNAWMPKIEDMLKTKEIEMVLVGLLHLVGKDSVLSQLEKKGYLIEQL